ncbi:unnamed protein product [Paramecium pentaurelia]|uniref:RING-type domain-containing protein n=1 Tax=Paramecium pentaurelia TaxID=43138 RepID=A0A8S1TYB2_9CILI|nr:unnamed protein product [Paramecium pentaurelia]
MANQVNNNLIDNDIQQSFQNFQILNQNKIEQPASLFDQGKEQFQQQHKFLAVFSLLKFVAATIIIILRQTLFSNEQPIKQYNHLFDVAYLEIWIYLSCLHSFFAFIYYIKLLRLIDDIMQSQKVAKEMGYLIEFYIPNSFSDQQMQNYIDEQIKMQNQEIFIRQRINDQGNDSRRFNQISNEIKKTLLKNNLSLNLHGKSCFIAFQFIQLWCIIFYFYSQTNKNQEEMYKFITMYKGYIFSVVFIGVYQYLQIYIMVLLVIIFLPILLIYSLYNWLNKHFNKKYKQIKIDDSLQEALFSSLEIVDDKECSICMTQFLDQEYIVTLPCSSTHRFHSSCIRSWLQVNNKCPLCRSEVNIYSEDNL